jgi:hypothetical protein
MTRKHNKKSAQLSKDTKHLEQPDKKTKTVYFTWVYIIVSIWIIVFYGKTIQYGYVLDDNLFIQNHKVVQEGISGIPRLFSEGGMVGNNNKSEGQQPYRPLTLTSFAIEHSLAPENSSFAHGVNLVLYILLAVAFIKWIKTLFPSLDTWILLGISLVYISHPAHIEVVSNIKSRDELLAALFGFLSFKMLYNIKPEKLLSRKAIAAGFLFFLGLLSKESIITFFPLAFLAMFIIQKNSFSVCFKKVAPFLVAVLLYLLTRYLAVGFSSFTNDQANIIHNTLFSPLSSSDFWGTKMRFLLEYIRILIMPHPLSWDYSYNQLPVTAAFSPISIVSIIIHLCLLISSIVYSRKYPIYAFWVLFYFISFSITNNLFFIIGATVSERLLFIPSAAFCSGIVLLASYLINIKPQTHQYRIFYILLPILIIYSVIDWHYIPKWKDNKTLFENGAIASPSSARAHFALATTYFSEATENTDTSAKKEAYKKALQSFIKGVNIFDGDPGIFNYIGSCYLQLKEPVLAIKYFKEVIKRRKTDETALHELAFLYTKIGETDSCIFYAKKFHTLFPSKIDGPLLLTGSYFFQEKYDSAYKYAQRAYFIDSTNRSAINNMAGVLQKTGKIKEADFYINKLR